MGNGSLELVGFITDREGLDRILNFLESRHNHSTIDYRSYPHYKATFQTGQGYYIVDVKDEFPSDGAERFRQLAEVLVESYKK